MSIFNTLAKRLILSSLLMGGAHSLAAPDSEELVNSFQKIYRSSKCPQDLLNHFPRVDSFAYNGLAQVLGKDFTAPLPSINFDLNKREIGLGKVHLRSVNPKEGSYTVNGRPFTYLADEDLDHNLKRLIDLVVSPKSKSAQVWMWLMPFAFAQPHNFELLPGVESTEAQDHLGTATGILAASPWMNPLLLNGTNVLSTAAFGSNFFQGSSGGMIGRTGFYGALAPFVYYGSNFATANAPGVPDCIDQAYTLARIMNEGQINLRELKCNNWSAFTPLQAAFVSSVNNQEFRFDVDWFTVGIRNRSLVQSIARVGPHTVMEFSRDEVVGVRLETPIIGPNDENSGRTNTKILTSASTGADLELFNRHKTEFERYRRVIREVARNNSCYRCQSEFSRILVRRGAYQAYRVSNPTPSVNTPSGAAPSTQ